MTTFFVLCGAMVLLSGAFYLWPRKPRLSADQDLDQANLQWYRLRQSELTGDGDEALQQDIRLRLLEDEQHPTQSEAVSTQSFPTWVLLPLIALGSAALYYFLGSAADVQITERLQNFDDSTSQEEVQQLMTDIEVRSTQRPENLHYVALLGRYFMGQENYPRATEIYDTLVEAAPEDAQALAFSAQAEYLAQGRKLTDRARLRAEQSLAADPYQRTSLGLLGMASFEQQQFRAAISYWERLLATEPPDSSSAQMIAGVIATARQNLGEAAPPQESTQLATLEAPQVSAGVTVRVELPENSVIAPDHTVFVLARNAESNSRMPIAVQRLSAAQLPITLRLDDSNSMAGQKLSATASVIVAVQVSPEGKPGESNASWLGKVGPLAPSLAQEPILVELVPTGR